MARGGHGRSGPPPAADSGRSERRGYKLTALPSEGFAGEAPDLADYLIDPSKRHLAVWDELWSTPQACVWSVEQWRIPVVADLARYIVRMDLDTAPASYATAIRQLRDDLGLSTAGLKQNGWSIAADEVAAKATERDEKAPRKSSRDRLAVVSGGD
jgi:hypothetical protein